MNEEPIVDTRRMRAWQIYTTGLPIILKQTFLLCFAVGGWRQKMAGDNKGKLGVFFSLFLIPATAATVLVSSALAWAGMLLSLLMFITIMITAPFWFLPWAWFQKGRMERFVTQKLRESLTHGA